MTMLEKAREMGLNVVDGIVKGCPYKHGLEKMEESRAFCPGHNCWECYAREYIDPEQDADQEAKADKGKMHPSYVHASAIKAIMEVREYGTAKYGDPENWRKVDFARYHEALLRHVLAMWNDPFAVDPESGLPHLYHVMCNGDFMCELWGEVLK